MRTQPPNHPENMPCGHLRNRLLAEMELAREQGAPAVAAELQSAAHQVYLAWQLLSRAMAARERREREAGPVESVRTEE